MRVVLVTGTRDLADPAVVHDELDKLKPHLVIHGAARGVDAAAAEWAAKHGRYVVAVPAQWREPDGKVDRAAGAKRNTVMVEFALRYKAVGNDVICLGHARSAIGGHPRLRTEGSRSWAASGSC